MKSRVGMEKRSFLIIDDNAHMVRIIEALLRSVGAKQIIEATDPIEGLQILRDREIDCIFVDYKMPVIDGLEFVHMVRKGSDSPNTKVPLIMVTAFTERSKVEAAMSAGVTSLVRKPIAATTLLSHIARAIPQSGLLAS